MEKVGWCVVFLSLAHASDGTDCGPPPPSPFSEVVKPKARYSDGDKVKYKCSEDYPLRSGVQFIQCVNGQWTPLALQCSRKCPVLDIPNAVYRKNRRPGDVIKVACKTQFQLKGAAQVTCSTEGNWAGEIPTCSLDCAEPGSVLDVLLMDQDRTQTSFPDGTRVRYRCDVGFTWTGGHAYRTCNAGSWTDLQMTCQRKSCGSAGEVLNGQYNYHGVQFGDFATVVCNEGYYPVGRTVRRCRDGGWDGRDAVCEAVQCSEPPEEASVMRTDDLTDGPYEHGSAIGYRCGAGKLIGPGVIYCTRNGTWSAPPPKCRDVRCPLPRFIGAVRSVPVRLRYGFGDTVAFRCHASARRYTPEVTVTCGLDGTWTPPHPCTHPPPLGR